MPTETTHVRDWPDAPADATHALLRPGAAITWLRLGARHESAYWLRQRNRVWVRDVSRSDRWLDNPQVVPKVYRLPAEAG